MNCPRCVTRGMEKFTVAETTLDRCQTCGGIWADPGEAKAISQAGLAEVVDTTVRHEHAGSYRLLHCPRCQVSMRRFALPGQGHIIIDQCEVCFGVFYDAGELADASEKSLSDFFKGLKARFFGAK